MAHRTRVGVVISHPIQYFSPLFDLLSNRGAFDISVAYWNDAGVRVHRDPGLGLTYKWDIDLLAGHDHQMMTFGERISPVGYLRGLARLLLFIRRMDLIVVHGYSSLPVIVAIFIARISRTPFLFRSDTSFRREHPRFSPKYFWPRMATKWSSGALAVGSMNRAIHQGLGAKSIYFAPFAIDVKRFESVALDVRRNQAKAKLKFDLDPNLPVIAYSGKLQPGKRVQDLIKALKDSSESIQLLIIGDGPMRGELERQAMGTLTVFLGFLNQSEIPYALACADVLVLPSDTEAWGLAINEAMACGCVPIVSSAVGCGPDLVRGIGEIYEVGDVDALARAIRSAVEKAREPAVRDQIREKLSEYSLDECAGGYEHAVQSVVSISP